MLAIEGLAGEFSKTLEASWMSESFLRFDITDLDECRISFYLFIV